MYIISRKPADMYARLKLGWANEVSKGGVGGGGRTWANFGGLTQSLVGESEEKRWPGGSEHEWFLGCCDASDVL